MILPVIIIFSFFILCKNRTFTQLSLIGLVIILSTIVTFKDLDTRDYLSYILEYQDADFFNIRSEPGYVLIESISNKFNFDYMVFFAVVALLSVGLKVFAIKKLSCYLSLSIAIYVCNFFILQDMIALRCAIAVGFLLWAVYFKLRGNNTKFLFFVTVAIFFHYSSALYYVVFFLDKEKAQVKTYLLLLFLGLVIGVSGTGFSSFLYFLSGIEQFNTLLNIHQYDVDEGSLSLFNAVCIMRLFIALFSLYMVYKLHGNNYELNFYTKIYIIALVIWFSFSDMKSLSVRGSELFQVVEIVLLPLLVRASSAKIKSFVYCGILVFCILLLYNNISIQKLLL